MVVYSAPVSACSASRGSSFSTYLEIRLTSGTVVAVLLGMTKWPGWPRAHLLRVVIMLVMYFRWEGRGTPAGDVPLGP